MLQELEERIQVYATQYPDQRVSIFDVRVKNFTDSVIELEGRVLESESLEGLLTMLHIAYPEHEVNSNWVAVLRKPTPLNLSVATNLTSMHAETSFLSEMTTQLSFGMHVEVLAEQGSWVYVRQDDGYLGWMYRPYLTDRLAPEATHLVIAPVVEVRRTPEATGVVLTRAMSGMGVRITELRGDWARVEANMEGWVPQTSLRAMTKLPQSPEQRRQTMLSDMARMVGVPYLWGGCTANGIDCSGLAQLLHRWVGLTLPRDADMQFAAGTPVEPPYLPGDLLFFGEKGEKRRITHVGISTGGWDILHSSRSRNGVYADNVQAVEHLNNSHLCACRYI